MTALSGPQLHALRYAKGRQLYAADVNAGNGNLRRTLLSLLKIGLLSWDPIYKGRLVITDLGEQKLQEAHQRDLAARSPRPRGVPSDRPGTLRIKDVGDRRVITLTGEHADKEHS
jgi:hypothetical protein